MACRLCRIPVESTLCNVCRCLVEEDYPTVNSICDSCGFPIDNLGSTLCRVCTALLVTVENSSWLMHSHDEWQRENLILATHKCELMGKEGSSEF
jgi:hypothetical protein